jgi:hypothetical protein
VKFKKAFDPLPGFTNFEALNIIFRQATGKSYSIDYVRGLIADKLPQYRGLADSAVESFFLIDEARHKGLSGKNPKFDI